MPATAGLIQAKLEWERKQAQLAEQIALSSDDPDEQKRIAARTSFLDFICYTFPSYRPNWHHRRIAELCDRVLRGELPRVILCMPPRYGKCLAAGSQVLMANGSLVAIEDIRPSDTVISINSGYNGCTASVSAVSSNGIKPVLKITLQSGRTLVCTENHPLLTVLGWTVAGELKVGDSVAAMRKTPIPDSGEVLPFGFAALMGYLVGDGSFSQGQAIVTTSKPEVVDHLTEIASAHGWVLSHDPPYSYHLRRPAPVNTEIPSAAARLRPYMKPAKAAGKRVPECIFRAGQDDLCAFLSAYFNTDANVNPIIDVAEFYSISKELLEDVQKLFTRLGIYSALRLKNGRYKGEVHKSYRLTISGEDVIKMAEALSVPGKRGEQLRSIAESIKLRKRHFPEYDAIPPAWKTLMKKSASWHRSNTGIRVDKQYKRGTARCVVEAIARAEDNEELLRLCNPELIWELIVKIEPIGDLPTYDIEVADTHNFIAEGVVVHNSENVSRRLPAYLLGRNPDAQIISTSYSADLASRINRDVQRIIESPVYVELFPESRLFGKNIRSVASGSYLRNSEIFEIVDHLGSYRSAGVEGGITGMGFGRLADTGGDRVISGVGIVDDPFKNRKEAESKTIRDSVWEWYTSTFLTRCEGDAAIIVVATRWHKDDLIGRLLKLAREDPLADQWEVFKFEAIRGTEPNPIDPREPGEPLWLAKHSLDKLMGIKASIGPYDWASLYQQEPTSDEGSIFDAEWVGYWRSLPQFEKVVISVHSNFREASAAESVTLQLWGKAGEQFYLIDQKRDRLTYLDVRDAILGWIDHWKRLDINVSEVLIEGKRNGKAVIESLASTCPCTVTPTDFGGDTEQGRAQAVSSFLASESVFIPLEAAWAEGFITELGDFPGSETVDQVGALTQALIYLALRAKTGLIYEFFNRSIHCLRGQDEADFGLDSRLPLHISLDFNRHPATAVVGQVRDKDLFILREFYLLESNTFELSEAICGWVERSGHRDKIYVYGDASGNSRTANSQQSNWEIVWDAFKRYGLKNRSVKRYGSANPPVRDTVISCNALFKAERVWILLSQCPELVKDLEQVVWKGDAIDKSDLMRAQVSDGFRYLVHALFPFRMVKLGGQQRSQKPVSGLAG